MRTGARIRAIRYYTLPNEGGWRERERERKKGSRTAQCTLPRARDVARFAANGHGRARARARVYTLRPFAKSHIVYRGRHLRKIIGRTRRYGVEAARRYPVYNRPIRSGYYLGNIQRRGRRLERAHAPQSSHMHICTLNS